MGAPPGPVPPPNTEFHVPATLAGAAVGMPFGAAMGIPFGGAMGIPFGAIGIACPMGTVGIIGAPGCAVFADRSRHAAADETTARVRTIERDVRMGDPRVGRSVSAEHARRTCGHSSPLESQP